MSGVTKNPPSKAMKAIVVLLLLLSQSFAEEQRPSTDPARGRSGTYRLDDSPEGSDLHIPAEHRIDALIGGKYELFGDRTEGYALYVFPDGKALLYNFSDISAGRVISEGRWSTGKGELTIKWGAFRFAHDEEVKAFHKRYGSANHFCVFVQDRKDSPDDEVILVPPERLKPLVKHYYMQVEHYSDWQKKRTQLLEPRAERQ